MRVATEEFFFCCLIGLGLNILVSFLSLMSETCLSQSVLFADRGFISSASDWSAPIAHWRSVINNYWPPTSGHNHYDCRGWETSTN